MCKIISVFAVTGEGEPYPNCSNGVTFEVDKFTPEKPTCTCWIGNKSGEGKKLRETFTEEVLREFLEKVSYGNIVIEIR